MTSWASPKWPGALYTDDDVPDKDDADANNYSNDATAQLH